MTLSLLPPPYTDCTVANIELPSSKSARAKLHQPYRTLSEAVRRYLVEAGGGYSVEDIETLLLDVPRSWERHEDLVVLPENSFKDPRWQPHLHCSKDLSQAGLVCKEVSLNGAKEEDQQPALLEAVALALNCKRLAIDQSIICDSFRSSGAKLLLGGDGWVDHLDNAVEALERGLAANRVRHRCVIYHGDNREVCDECLLM